MLLGTSQPDPFHGFGNQALSFLSSWIKLNHHASRFGTASFEYRACALFGSFSQMVFQRLYQLALLASVLSVGNLPLFSAVFWYLKRLLLDFHNCLIEREAPTC